MRTMTAFDIARQLISSGRESRAAILYACGPVPAAEIAEALQQICYEVWTDDPQQVSEIVDTLSLIADATGDREVIAYEQWTESIRSLINGELDACIEHLDLSESGFLSMGKPHLAAKTQTSKLYALALLGRYDEAVDCGLRAREVFLTHDDLYSTGKIEHNIGNLYWRRDMYRESEPFLASAHQRFEAIDDQRQLAMVENCQAFVASLENRFRDAESTYLRALGRAEKLDLKVTEAEIETGLSNLYLFEGKYDLALKNMERSRKKYESLGMFHQSVGCELEIADIYLELNLLPEAIDRYIKVEGPFIESGMQAELARCLKNHAIARFRTGEVERAAELLDRAQQLCENEGNEVAAGSVMLARANLLLSTGNFGEAESQAATALSKFDEGGNLRLELYTRWLGAEIRRASGRPVEAEAELRSTLETALENSSQVEYLCRISLGQITGDAAQFEHAVELVESSRESLVSEDLRTSYFADKVLPYNELVRLHLAQLKYAEAFRWHERSRGRTLLDSVNGSGYIGPANDKIAEVRDELNWLHNRLNRSTLTGSGEREQIGELRKLVAEREKEFAELKRRLRAEGTAELAEATDLDIDDLCRRLDDTAIIEFAIIGGRVSAFVFSPSRFSAVPEYADEQELNREISQFLFQIKTGRFIDRLSPQNRESAIERLDRRSRRIYDLLLRPLGSVLDTGRLVFAPAGMLHYLPFHALNDGRQTLIERAEISYVPSVSLLDRCLKMERPDLHRALLAGVPGDMTPGVLREVDTVRRSFADAAVLIGPDVRLANIQREADGRGVIHLACHGKFRPDNPGFSSLVLFDEEMSVNDVRDLRFKNSIIVLSACESGLSEVVRGEELIGLTQAFFAAGAGSVVMSLWRVNDNATLGLMTSFYSHLAEGKGVAGSLRRAQIAMIGVNSHPFFWSPFIASGRW